MSNFEGRFNEYSSQRDEEILDFWEAGPDPVPSANLGQCARRSNSETARNHPVGSTNPSLPAGPFLPSPYHLQHDVVHQSISNSAPIYEASPDAAGLTSWQPYQTDNPQPGDFPIIFSYFPLQNAESDYSQSLPIITRQESSRPGRASRFLCPPCRRDKKKREVVLLFQTPQSDCVVW